MSLNLSKCHIVVNHMSRLILLFLDCNKLAPGTISLISDQALGDEIKLKCVF